MKLTIYTSDACGQAANVYYPNKVDVTDERSFKKAVSFDHVAASCFLQEKFPHLGVRTKSWTP